MAASLPVLFPQPQEIELGAGRLVLAQGDTRLCSIVIPGDASDTERIAADVVRSAIGARCGLWPCVVSDRPLPETVPHLIGKAPALPLKGYLHRPIPPMRVDVLQVYLRRRRRTRSGQCGHSLRQSRPWRNYCRLDGAELTLPLITIRDWPQFRYRGLYVESKWGPDRMTLSDWQDLIDHMASLKLNFLGVGVYGCWNIQYDQKPTEFMMIPLRKFPDLKTPKTISYYSGREDSWKAAPYLPRMFEEDFFGGNRGLRKAAQRDRASALQQSGAQYVAAAPVSGDFGP